MCNMDTVATHRWQSPKDLRSQEGLAEENYVYLSSPVLSMTVYGPREIFYQKHKKPVIVPAISVVLLPRIWWPTFVLCLSKAIL